ncbi:MAG: amidohydrolase family protein [Sphingomonadaceae bacterium]|nr:amidohydrolase family protein [Sphingomonadaceae bacterium]
MSATLITNARLVCPTHADMRPGALLIRDGRIVTTGDVTAQDAEIIDAQGALLTPGIVDLGVFATDMAACHAGGITRIALMPDGPPALDNPGLIERAAKAGKPDLWIHPLAAATRDLAGAELAEIGLMQQAGARAVATGRHRIADSALMLNLLRYAGGLGLVTITHAEDEGLVHSAVATEGEMATRLGLAAAPTAAESIAIARDIALVEVSGAPLHFRQVTTRAGFDLIRRAKAAGLPVTCGITPAHLLLSDIALGEWRSFARLSPPLRQDDDRQAALEALRDGAIDVIASGHDPRGPEDKRLPFAAAQPGMAGAASLLALTLGLVRDGYISLPRLFDLIARTPARLLGLNVGTLTSGAEADLALINPDTAWRIDARHSPARSSNTPFDGLGVEGRVRALWKGGKRVA